MLREWFIAERIWRFYVVCFVEYEEEQSWQDVISNIFYTLIQHPG